MDLRNPRLKKIFDDVVTGDRQLDDPLIPHFIRSISTHPDPATCLHTLITSEHGLKAVQAAVSSDVSTESLNGDVAVLLAYPRDSKLEHLGGGDSLQRLLRALVEAPDFWKSLVIAFSAGQLQQSTELSFSWLFFQLVVSPPEIAEKYRHVVLDTDIVQTLLRSPVPEIRSNARKIDHIVSLYSNDGVVPPDWLEAPGWRHNNDPCSYREISILPPTPDEINTTERPCLKTVGEIEDLGLTSPIEMLEVHIENQFRLLREDLVQDTRENVQVALGKKKGKRAGEFISGLLLTGIYTDEKSKWGLEFTCSEDLPLFPFGIDDIQDRAAFLKKDRNYLRNGSFACLVSGNEIVAFVTIIRDVYLLAQDPPVIAVKLEGRAAIKDTLLKLRQCPPVSLAQISTPLFAYEPVLRGLQGMRPTRFLLDGALFVKPHNPRAASSDLSDIDQERVSALLPNLQTAAGFRKPITLDDAQMKAFICGLTQKVALIQGPPGTGKSFSGALLVKAFHKLSGRRILVCCYTNHALDQFLEDLLKWGIPESHMVRLGSKPSPSTASMALSAQTGYRFGVSDWEEIREMSSSLNCQVDQLKRAFSRFNRPPSSSELLNYLKSTYPEYFEALTVPPADDDMILIGESGRAIGHTYLLSRWLSGRDAGVLRDRPVIVTSGDVWGLSLEERKKMEAKWGDEILGAQMEAVLEAGIEYNASQEPLSARFRWGTRRILRSKRIIACTTTGAAIYRDAIQYAGPDILVVEEAGEVLESHVLTALSRTIQRLILIGDHKQLRPKINNYELTVEKGDGYDLNRSLFERLVVEGHPYCALSKQHRMRPEISALVRHLTYPDLTDGPGTVSRPPIRGLQNMVMFIDHKHPEDDDPGFSDPKHVGVTTPKRNKFEVDMISEIVRYLKQQGYDLGEITVLTPYLGQLVAMREALGASNEVAFGELDTEELEAAGLSDLLSALKLDHQRTKTLKISTIDNYQGEENDIIVASLTRGNEEGNIGFMSSPERLNVLLSRARNGLIIVGNSETFLKSRGGKEIWSKFFDKIKQLGYIYEGLPVQCERHNDTKNVLKLPEDFRRLCPDGGCTEPCGTTMSCGIHTCPRKCHNHKDPACGVKVQMELPCGHSISRRCYQSKALPGACVACELAKQKAGVDKADENDAGTSDRAPTFVNPRPPAFPISPTSSWRDRQTSPTTDNRSWRSGRPKDRSTNVFDAYCGPGRSPDAYKDGLFNRSKPQSDSPYSSQGGSDRTGVWRPTYSKW